jgi:O-antigen/teichoic acid export membrane protein
VGRDGAPRFGSDVLHFGGAVLLVLVLNIAQVFIVPRRLSVEAYGEYRVFLLYVGYLGVLHLGVVDGAFLRWVGRPLSLIRREWPTVLRRLLLMQLPVFAVAVMGYAFAAGSLTRVYVIAFALCAVAANLTAFASFTLQAAGDFRGAGRVTALPPGLFAVAVVSLPIASLTGMLSTYIASYAIAAAAGLGRLSTVTARASNEMPPEEVEPLSFLTFIATGLPVLGAGIATGLSQFADRILVSLAVPVATFAFYGFAASTMALSGAARQTLSRVALAHAARRTGAQRAAFVDGVYDLIAAGFGVALLAEPVFESVVRRVLPRYLEALPIVRALIPGALFWVATNVVVLSVLQTYGYVRRQFLVSILCAALAAAGAAIGLALHAPLWGVAGSASAGTVVAWIAGVVVMQRVVPDSHPPSAVWFFVISAVQGVALAVALALAGGWVARTVIYTLIAFWPTLVSLRAARDHWIA